MFSQWPCLLYSIRISSIPIQINLTIPFNYHSPITHPYPLRYPFRRPLTHRPSTISSAMSKKCMLCTMSDKRKIPDHICGQHCALFPDCGNTNSLVACNLSNCVVTAFQPDPEDSIVSADTLAGHKGPRFEGGDLGDYGTTRKHEQRIDGEHAVKTARERSARGRTPEEREDQPLNKKRERKTKKEVNKRERKESRKQKQESNESWS